MAEPRIPSPSRRVRAVLGCLLAALALVLGAAPAASAQDRARVLDDDAPYPEGPLWRHGALFYTDYANSRVSELRHGVKRTVWQQDGCGASALLALPLRRMLVTCYDSNTLVVIDERGRTVRTIAHDTAGHPFLGPNDFTRDARGGVYFSASGVYDANAPIQGKVYYLAPDGTIRAVARHVHYSNGMAVGRDGRLLVAEMLANRVLSFRIRPDGSLSDRRVFADMADVTPGPPPSDPYTGPDGLKVDHRGRVYVAENGTGRVVVLDASGAFVASAKVPARYVTNVALGPGRQVYVTAAYDANAEPYPGAVFAVRLP